MAIWEKDMESCPRQEMEQLQIERLQSSLNRAYKNVSFYREVFNEKTVVPEDVKTFSDLSRLPFTTKHDLQNNYPYGLFAVPLREVVRIHTTSETIETPPVIGYTKNDLKHWAALVARFLVAADVTPDDVIQISFLYGLFSGAFGLHHGAEQIGASVIPASGGNTEKQIRIIQNFRTTVLAATPSFAMILADKIDELGIDPKSLMLKKILLGGEIWSEKRRTRIQERLFVDAIGNYGVSELSGPGIAAECPVKNGLHISEDHFLPEIIDPATGTVLPAGQEGELVLTTLTREAFPLIRYRTGDITSLDPSPCKCGRTLVRMKNVTSRTDSIITIKGVNLVPEQIEKTLTAIEGCEPHYQVIAETLNGHDVVEVDIEVSENIFYDEMKKQSAFLDRVRETLSHHLGIQVDVRLVERNTLAEKLKNEGKVVDKRHL